MMLPHRRALAILAVIFLATQPRPAGAQVPMGNDTSDGNSNTGGGKNALANNGGGNETAYGFGALFQNTTGGNNSAVGASALTSNTTGDNNTASGVNALFANTTGSDNTASGVDALFQNTEGGHNAAFGVDALFANTTGSGNTAAGAGALRLNTTGSENTGCGGNALAVNTTGQDNTAGGADALKDNTTGARNTAVGVNALGASTTGSGNVALGAGAGGNLRKGNTNIYVGNSGEASESKTIRIGSAQKHTFIAGIAQTAVSGSSVTIDANGQLGVFLSSARYKRDIQELGDASARLVDLRPITFRYREDSTGGRQYGLIAEEVARVYPDLVVRSAAGDVQSIKYEQLIPLLIGFIQQQQRQIDAQARTLAELSSGRRGVGDRMAAAPSP